MPLPARIIPPTSLALTAGARLGPFEILSPLGAGGMGEVYRARDTTLDRDVAIKILPDAFVSDPERVARFQREAKTLASLNHPNIAIIHGLEAANGAHALVMELVEGEDLSTRITRGPVPLDEALAIAKQIAEALEAAHEQGIVHRDLKPANIKIKDDGTVKILDFGLAKAMEPTSGSSPNVSQSPTITTPAMMTGVGMILGTAAYMSPEQAKGHPADKRSDIWAFGCVLFEMLAGKCPFAGDTVSEILADVLKTEPDWAWLPATTPDGMRRLLRRCLEKDVRRRLQHVGDARLEIEDALTAPHRYDPAVRSRLTRRERVVWLSALGLVVLIAVVSMIATRGAGPMSAEIRVEITTPPTTDPVSIAISPDGQTIAFVAAAEGRSQLWLRALGGVAAQPLPKTAGATLPFWAPDNRSLGFFAEGQLKRIDIDGGVVQTLATARSPTGGSWSRHGVILFTETSMQPLSRVSAGGGVVTPVTQLHAPDQAMHSFPHFLPDGQHFLYSVRGTADTRGLWVGALDGSVSRRLLETDSAAVYADASQQLLFVRQGTLFAQPFDPARAALSGKALPVAEQLATLGETGAGVAVSASAAGPIAYRTGSAGGLRQLVWIDRSGKEIAKLGEPDNVLTPSMSPDGHHVAVTRVADNNPNIYVMDTIRGGLTRFTSHPAPDIYAIWSPDGHRIAFSSPRTTNGELDLYWKPVGGAGTDELLLASGERKLAVAWSPDGQFLVYRTSDPRTGVDLWALPLATRVPFPVRQTDADERDAQFSPNGKWIAYQSNETGRYEIYVQPFVGSARPIRISNTGGAQVRWGSDGTELFYIALDNQLQAVPIQFAADGLSLQAEAPVPLFNTHVGGAVQTFRQQYVVSSDGQRFLMDTTSEEASSTPITLILNWRPKSPAQ